MIQLATYTVLAAALYFDIRERRIPNAIVVCGAVAGVLLQSLTPGAAGLSMSVLGFATGLVILLPLFAFGKFGAGDVKLLAALGALRGFSFIWRATLLGALAGGVIAVVQMSMKRELSLSVYGAVTQSYRSTLTMAYAPAIAIGVLLADLGVLPW